VYGERICHSQINFLIKSIKDGKLNKITKITADVVVNVAV
jgi:hypothetical protein